MIFITATGGVLSIILIIALAFLLRQRDRLSLGNRKNRQNKAPHQRGFALV